MPRFDIEKIEIDVADFFPHSADISKDVIMITAAQRHFKVFSSADDKK